MMNPKSNSPWPEVFAPLAIAIAFSITIIITYKSKKKNESLWFK